MLSQIKQRYGQGLLAVLIYGSYLRGKRDTLLDFYVLLDSYSSVPKAWQGLACQSLATQRLPDSPWLAAR